MERSEKYSMSLTDVKEIKSRSIHGILALTSRTFFLNIVSLTSSIVIFSVLSPKEVGVYTAVISIQRIIAFFSDFGFGAALIQKKDHISNEDIQTTFTLQAIITLAIVCIVFILLSPILTFFQLNDTAGRLLLALVFTLFLSSFKTVPSILLERTIQFHKLILPQLVESVVFNLVVIFLLFNSFNLDSFTIAFLVSGIVSIPIYYIIAPWKLGIGIYKTSLRHLHYGLQFQAKNILATVKDDLLTVFLTRVLSYSEIGYIGFGQRIAFFMYRYIVDSVTKVTFSTYARLAHQQAYLEFAVEKSLFYVSVVMFPALFGLIVTIPYIISYIPKWQNKWEPAILSVIFFSLNAVVSSLSGILINVLDATGHVKSSLKLMVLWTMLIWILTPLLIYLFGYNGVSLASFIVTLSIIITIFMVKNVVKFNFIKSVYKPFLMSLLMLITVYGMEELFVTNVFSLVVIICLGAITYVTGMYIIAREEIMSGFRIITKK